MLLYWTKISFQGDDMTQASTIRPHWARTTHTPTPLSAEAEYRAADQERWEAADDLDAEQEDREREPIDDSPKDWAPFELEIDELYSHNLDGLLPK
jgi:hypothetical protein